MPLRSCSEPRSVAQGPAAGVVTAAGVSVGLVGHTALAALGLGAILRTSELLFAALKLVGAAYLVWLGIGLLRTKSAELALGLVFAGLTFLVKGPVGLFAGLLSGWLRSRPRALQWLYRSSGAVLVALGVRLALEQRQ